MKVVTTPPFQTESDFSAVSRSRSRTAIIFAAFWHTLRRDVMVTFREFIPFLMQSLISPFSLLLVFGRILPGVGTTQQLYPATFFPGVVAFTIFMASLLGITLTLMLDLAESREIDDRLLAPMPVSLVALEKILFSVVRSLVAGALIFLLARWILGSGYQVRTDALLPLIGIMVLYAFTSAAMGLVIGAALPADKIYMLFSLVVSATMYTGCVYYTWISISSIKVFQVITLFNPLTYAAEGLRSAMVPSLHEQAFSTLPIGWVLLGLGFFFLVFLVTGIRIFHRRVIS